MAPRAPDDDVWSLYFDFKLNSHEIVRNISKGHIGLGFCLLNRPVLNLESIRLFREEFRLFCAREHPFYGRDAVAERELRQEPFISFTCATEGMGLEPMVVLRASSKLGSRITGTSSNLQEVKRMIIAGLGIGILPPDSMRHDMDSGVLWPLKVTDHPVGADVYLVHAPPADLSTSERRFIQTAEELAALHHDST